MGQAAAGNQADGKAHKAAQQDCLGEFSQFVKNRKIPPSCRESIAVISTFAKVPSWIMDYTELRERCKYRIKYCLDMKYPSPEIGGTGPVIPACFIHSQWKSHFMGRVCYNFEGKHGGVGVTG
jgi:hypothetical protein